MKFHSIIASIVIANSVLLTACQSSSVIDAPVNSTKNMLEPLTESKLQYLDWQLISVTDRANNKIQQNPLLRGKPLILKFENDGKLRFKNTCNIMWGNYSLSNNNIVVDDIASTMKLCDSDGMAFDTLASSTVKGQFTLIQNTPNQALLTVTSDSQVSVFKGIAK